jgi:hypothetical protein
MYIGGSHSAVRTITVFDIRASGRWIPVSGVCVCVCERERESVRVCVCVVVCVCKGRVIVC